MVLREIVCVWVRRLAVFGPLATDCCGRLRCVPSERLWASADGAVMLAVGGASDQQCASQVFTEIHAQASNWDLLSAEV
jgi:hypothetical protein